MRSLLTALATLFVVSGLTSIQTPSQAAQTNAVTRTLTVYGDVRDGSAKTPSTVVPDGLPPISGATISVPILGVNVQTDARGHFEKSVTATLTPPQGATYEKVAATATAPGFGTWSISGLPAYITSAGMRLYIELTSAAQSRTYVPYEETPLPARKIRAEIPSSRAPGLARPQDTTVGCTGYSSTLFPPGQIKLYHVASNTIELVNFNFYIRGVLPREWPGSSPLEAYKAGAVAIRTYSWRWAIQWRQGTDTFGNCYDLSDDPGSYQAYDQSFATAESDTAVSAMWDWYLTDGTDTTSPIFDAQYASGFAGEACGANATGRKMYQYGTVACANQGMAWWQILDQYYWASAGITRHTVGAAPAATATADATNLDVFVRGANGDIYQTYRRSGTWFPWYDLGQPIGVAISDPGAAWSNSGQRLDVWVRGNDDHLYVRTWTNVAGWAGWQDIGSGITDGVYGAAQRSTGASVDAFSRGTTPTYQARKIRWNGSTWSGWQDLGAPGGRLDATIPWEPAAVWWQPNGNGRIDMFVIGNDVNTSLYQNFSADDITWQGWFSLGGQLSSAPAVGAYSSGNEIDVLARGLDASIYRLQWNGVSWQPWQDLGAPDGASSGPGATWANGDSELDVFVRGDSNHLWWRQLIGGTWTGWADLAAYP